MTKGRKNASTERRKGWPDVAYRFLDAVHLLIEKGSLTWFILFNFFFFTTIILVRLPPGDYVRVVAILSSKGAWIPTIVTALGVSALMNIGLGIAVTWLWKEDRRLADERNTYKNMIDIGRISSAGKSDPPDPDSLLKLPGERGHEKTPQKTED